MKRDARGRRIRTARRDVERALRSREQLQESIRTTDAAAGHAIRRLLNEGLAAVDAAVLVRLSRSQIKRLVRLTGDPAEPETGRWSTGFISGGASRTEDADRDTNGGASSATTEGRL